MFWRKKKKTYPPDLEGTLKVLPVDGIFQLIYHTNLTGKMVLTQETSTAAFFFDNGALVWGALDDGSNKHIGQRLIESGLVSQEQLDECLGIHRKNKTRRVGTIMIEKGYLNREKLQDVLKNQVRDAFFGVLSWNSGSFTFSTNIPAGEDITFDERIDHLMIEGFISMDHDRDGEVSDGPDDISPIAGPVAGSTD